MFLSLIHILTDKKELENSNGFGNYSIRAEEDNSYVISIGDCRFITIRFNIEEAKGRLHGGCGAASMREYLENEACLLYTSTVKGCQDTASLR